MFDYDGRQIPSELKEIVEPKRTVLLVWDMQNDQAGGSFNKAASRPCTLAKRLFSGKRKRSHGYAGR
jgi:isochorismate hydrolase